MFIKKKPVLSGRRREKKGIEYISTSQEKMRRNSQSSQVQSVVHERQMNFSVAAVVVVQEEVHSGIRHPDDLWNRFSCWFRHERQVVQERMRVRRERKGGGKSRK